MLVVPVIELLDGIAVDHLGRPLSMTDCSYADPAKMARLWRVQNARVLHVIDRQSVDSGVEIDFPSIENITRCLDIPVELEAKFSRESINRALHDFGVSRVVVRIDLSGGTVDGADLSEMVGLYGGSALCALLTLKPADLESDNAREHVLKQIGIISEAGCRRVAVRLDALPTDSYHRLLSEAGSRHRKLKFSAACGIDSYRSLKQLELNTPRNVDSVILNRALYENRFPCQNLWCWHRKEQVDLEKFSSATLLGKIES